MISTRDNKDVPICLACAEAIDGEPPRAAKAAPLEMIDGNDESAFCSTAHCVGYIDLPCMSCEQGFCERCIILENGYPFCTICIRDARV